MIVFVSNFMNHHQFPVAQELFNLTAGEYRFIETSQMPESFKKGGYSLFEKSWVIKAWQNQENNNLAQRLIREADVVVWCNNLYLSIIKQRLKEGKLTFEFGERWFKRGLINILSPRLLKSQLYYHLYFYDKPLYRLNASAYAANDLTRLHSFKNKMFKWGYFTAIPIANKKNLEAPRGVSRLKILFVSRFLIWKHPEIPVAMAARLKRQGYDFELNMYGSGPELNKIKKIVEKEDLGEYVHFLGNRPNNEILEEMRVHDIFLFTSDQNEGWGAVVNEAMSNGCAVVASDKIGSVPFLISNNENGLIFKTCSVEDLTEKVKYLLDNPLECKRLGSNAIHTISEVWSPTNAAKSFLSLVEGLNNNNPNIVIEGPCSPASPIKNLI